MKEKQLQQIIAESMNAGSLLAEQNYGGEINNQNYRSFVMSLMKLKKLTQEFTIQNNLSEINVDEIFPIHLEIEELLNL